ncbi:helix-turn-helix domain-containing protein [Jiangella anatolica]|uniref:XRE family transcriptional regulator n=1 Tax=Jiangella anatolica TaxID=2670374 RepID=A0A2W2BLG7_9ACTN|nr:helix-turn-helix transcriptional regulator [Jiangella anatolica]PZF81128.1 XRE family transcriptional regulator [Jiangella anatolica]
MTAGRPPQSPPGDGVDRAGLLDAFGRTVRAARERRGLSQEDLADLAGLHRTYVGAVERGERNVTLTTVARLALALDVAAPELLPPPGPAGAIRPI